MYSEGNFKSRFGKQKGNNYFVIDPMHTMSAGAFGRRLRGITLKASEGKLEVAELKQADYRINMFRGCKPYEFERFLRPLTSSVKKYKHHELRDVLFVSRFQRPSSEKPA